jgi:hypothetical protein
MNVSMPRHATVVAYIALFIALGGTAVAATGHTFVLGRTNRASAESTLTNTTGTPLRLNAKNGHAPLSVNTTNEVAHLNASLLDGKSESAFQSKLKIVVVTGSISNIGGDANCPSGYRVVGGGFNLPFVSDPADRDFVRSSRPDTALGTEAWSVILDPSAANSFQVNAPSTVYAVCVG